MADEEVKLEEETSETEGGEEQEGSEAEAPSGIKRFFSKKMLLMLVLPLVLMIAGGSAAYFMGFFGAGASTELNCEKVEEGSPDFATCLQLAEEKEGKKPGSFLDVPNMIVNLNSPAAQPRFLKISLKLELNNDEEQAKIEPLLPRVVDQFQMYLRELRIEDLRGTSGIYRMKIELLSRVRAAAPDVQVRDVLFQEILVQ